MTPPEIKNWASNNNLVIITKEDHQLLLDNQEMLRKEWAECKANYENLKAVHRSNELMERCATIDSLVACLKVPMINYLDEFGKPVENVSPFRGDEINQTIDVKICYVVWGGKIQYSCEIDHFVRNSTGAFGDGGVVRTFKKRNLCVLRGPTISAPYDIPQRGFRGFRYSPFIF